MRMTVTAIRRVPYDGTVYNLAVAHAESYIAEGIVVHNCRHTYLYFPADTPGARVEFNRPPEELVRKHAHFVSQPAKYEPLRVPASPNGRDFIVRRVKDPETGEIVTRLHWLKQPDEPVTAAARETLVRLLGSPLEATAASIDEVIAANDLQPLVDAGWLRVVETRGPARTTVAAATDELAAREAVLRAEPLARIESVEQVAAGAWQVVYTLGDGRRVQLTARGRTAALVEQERMREAQAARQPRLIRAEE